MSTYQDRARLVLEELVTSFAEKDEQGEWWGHDTDLGNQEEAFDQALSELASIVEEERLQGRFDEHREWVLPWTETAIQWEQDGEGSGILYFDNERLDRLNNLKGERDQLSNRSKSNE